jgi:hypothetical protein
VQIVNATAENAMKKPVQSIGCSVVEETPSVDEETVSVVIEPP